MVGEVAQSSGGVHYQAWSGLNNSGEVIARVRRFAKLLLIKGGCDVAIFCLQQRLRFTGDVYSLRGRADHELYVPGGDLSERDGQNLFRFLETGESHRDGITAGIQELETIDAILIG